MFLFAFIGLKNKTEICYHSSDNSDLFHMPSPLASSAEVFIFPLLGYF
jgi:hypothetical protein